MKRFALSIFYLISASIFAEQSVSDPAPLKSNVPQQSSPPAASSDPQDNANYTPTQTGVIAAGTGVGVAALALLIAQDEENKKNNARQKMIDNDHRFIDQQIADYLKTQNNALYKTDRQDIENLKKQAKAVVNTKNRQEFENERQKLEYLYTTQRKKYPPETYEELSNLHVKIYNELIIPHRLKE